jgi:hypothetical protein
LDRSEDSARGNRQTHDDRIFFTPFREKIFVFQGTNAQPVNGGHRRRN